MICVGRQPSTRLRRWRGLSSAFKLSEEARCCVQIMFDATESLGCPRCSCVVCLCDGVLRDVRERGECRDRRRGVVNVGALCLVGRLYRCRKCDGRQEHLRWGARHADETASRSLSRHLSDVFEQCPHDDSLLCLDVAIGDISFKQDAVHVLVLEGVGHLDRAHQPLSEGIHRVDWRGGGAARFFFIQQLVDGITHLRLVQGLLVFELIDVIGDVIDQ
mmetsp:Transcript_38299/g.95929  ORF Transcript_38299/g.95929 Transcript_38299/m.95929 type:complete len:218 (-) Transcript_38299:260-913(-)